LTELGNIEQAVPRTHRFAPIAVVRAHVRPTEQLDRITLACFGLGSSIRKLARPCRQSSDGRSVRLR
jgi:hypothetical protein